MTVLQPQSNIIELRPQKGPQEMFLATPADIAIYGGAAGGGKSWGLLFDPMRHINNAAFGGVIFRRTFPQIDNEGGLWDEATIMYVPLGGKPRQTDRSFRFRSNMTISFRHMEHEKNKLDWQGAQIPYIGFDELTHFTRGQFMYMLSRNRSMCGVRPYMRGTCNPDYASFVAELIQWYLQEDGFPDMARSGKLRYFIRDGEQLVWGNSREELARRYPSERAFIKSFTFIAANVYDNKILLRKNPDYLGNLKALSRFERMQLLEGNWKVRPVAGLLFQREWFTVIERHQLPASRRAIRYWDRAATEKSEDNDPAWTAGVLMSTDGNKFYIEDVVRFRARPAKVQTTILHTARVDGLVVPIGIEQDPGQAGVAEATGYVTLLAGFDVRLNPARDNKMTRALPFSAQAEHGNVCMVRGNWNNDYLSELVSFDGENGYMDQVDASSGALKLLTLTNTACVGPHNVLQESYYAGANHAEENRLR